MKRNASGTFDGKWYNFRIRLSCVACGRYCGAAREADHKHMRVLYVLGQAVGAADWLAISEQNGAPGGDLLEVRL